MQQLTIDDLAAAPAMKAGCSCWTYDFKMNSGKCKVSGELHPDEGPENLFRCDFEYEQCSHYLAALKESSA